MPAGTRFGSVGLMARKPRFRNRGAGKGVKEALTPERLEQLYVQERLTQKQIADRYNCSAQFVSLLLKDAGITRRHRDRNE